ncbi:hypothetical protein HMPREF0322_00702 [Desulfitobacterium hafniense DP7]|uniref:GPR1/FUN34/YaaH family protein n=1 Tax=Desulfitobacterium hafniense DP7 TaxID=537010 RepID=G9XIC6_DESHA|nr:hypothetical protein [Desulfitobacterium hafniense]EHL08609.1 hypothetical protein HMPREF0322_00702 [Desulfitobacterium hafniense DP7]
MEHRQDMVKSWADPSALGNICIGLLLLAQWGFFTGITGPATGIVLLPWLLTAIPVIFVIVFIQFHLGDFVGGTVNGLLGIVLMGQGAVKGIIALLFILYGKDMPPTYGADAGLTDALPLLCAFVVLLAAGFLSGLGQSKIQAICVWVAAVGFLLMALASLGINPVLGLVGGCCMLVIGLWLFYAGIALLLNGAAGKSLLPLGKPFGKK